MDEETEKECLMLVKPFTEHVHNLSPGHSIIQSIYSIFQMIIHHLVK